MENNDKSVIPYVEPPEVAEEKRKRNNREAFSTIFWGVTINIVFWWWIWNLY